MSQRRKHKYRNDMEKPFNFCREAAKGCHVCLMAPNRTSDFLIGLEKFYADEYDSDVEIPSVALDPDTNTLTLTNTHDYALSATISVKGLRCLGKDGTELQAGYTVSKDGCKSTCTTFIVKIPANTFLHVCRLVVDLEREGIKDRDELLEFVMQKLDSDVQRCEGHSRPNDFHLLHLTFPFQNTKDEKDECFYLCTQGIGGSFTHTFYGNYHAIDFRCEVGTPIVAGANGIVTDVRNNAQDQSTGISASNLYSWNSIQIRVTEEVNIKDGEVEEINADSAEQRSSSGASTTASARTGIAGLSMSEATAAAAVSSPSSSKVGQAGPLYIEYVHVQENSFKVQVGDVVERGQIICRSGESGFCPEPHLHFSAFRTSDSKAPTVGVKFIASEVKDAFVPEAGKMYNARVGERKI